MKETCGCCEGIHEITPTETRNRPGLDAISYRVGTHSTFLETMLARLSSFYLEDDEPGGQPLKERSYPLRNLSTRDSDDPAIAMLDAWATVADVLTFYQERIANEGYLRTATERRSVLELARLVGYALRPGVASSTYLAYTLEKDSIVTIPAGSRAQSVPGPGETMQSFETSDDLPARTEWNILQPRLTYPQAPDAPENVDGNAIYFKGVNTNLKPNDAILIDFGNPPNKPANVQELFRVIKVEPDAVADRTKVTLQSWSKKSGAAQAAIASPQTKDMEAGAAEGGAEAQRFARGERVRDIIERYSDEKEFADLLKTSTGKKVSEQLEALRDSLGATETELAQFIDEDALPKLRDLHRAAVEGNFTRLEPWIQELITDLEGSVERLQPAGPLTSEQPEAGSKAFASTTASGAKMASQPGPTQPAQQASKTDLDFVLRSIEKPASIPPPGPLRLDRKVTDIFSADSDMGTNILTTLRPALGELLLTSLENLPVTESTPARVYAMRTRASVFGHNAPLQNILGKEGEDKGKVVDQKEWTLIKAGETRKEEFSLSIRFFISTASGDNSMAFRTTIKIGAVAAIDDPSSTTVRALKTTPPFDINYAAAGENPIKATVVTQATGPVGTQGFPQADFEFKFPTRQITLKIHLESTRELRAESTGLDPSSFRFSFSQEGNDELPPVGFVPTGMVVNISGSVLVAQPQATERARVVALDTTYPQILPSGSREEGEPESWVVLERSRPLRNATSPLVISRISQVKEVSRADYGLALKSTQLTLEKPWLNTLVTASDDIDLASNDFGDIRSTTVFAQSELMELSEAPIDPLENAICGSVIELDGLYSGLPTGRWLIITGERTDITSSQPQAPTQEQTSMDALRDNQFKHDELNDQSEARTITLAGEDAEGASGQPANSTGAEGGQEKPPVIGGLRSTELVMLAGLRQSYKEELPGDKIHTTLLLANDLAYCYKRDTVTIYGNVAAATHGETRTEVLGSGDASIPLQTFTLKQPPLTFVSAPTISGIDSTLKVRVNDILWRETDSLAELGQKDRRYLTRTDDEGKTRVIFGNGQHGARPATGIENITAVYRNGIGKPGNVKPGQISILATKPLGVKDVVNPLAATGGADKEDRDTGRRNAPLAVMSLDRLVSVRDYEDFTRTFAGIGKVSAARLSDGRRQVVFLTIAGADDIPIAETSDLLQNLRLALRNFGDPFQAVQIKKRLLKLIIISAGVRVHPDYLWEKVEPKVRAALLDKFSFARRDLGQPVLLSEVISTIQMVEGVVYVDVDTLGWINEDVSTEELSKLSSNLTLKQRIQVEMARVDNAATEPEKRLRPAELAILSPKLPDTIILKELQV
jgi:hypothetical protein